MTNEPYTDGKDIQEIVSDWRELQDEIGDQPEVAAILMQVDALRAVVVALASFLTRTEIIESTVMPMGPGNDDVVN